MRSAGPSRAGGRGSSGDPPTRAERALLAVATAGDRVPLPEYACSLRPGGRARQHGRAARATARRAAGELLQRERKLAAA